MKNKSLFKKIGWFGVFNIVLALLFATAFIFEKSVSSAIADTIYYKQWTGDSEYRFTQMAVYLSESDTVTKDDIYSFRSSLNQALKDASLEANEGGSLFNDAYIACGSMSIQGSRQTCNAKTYGLGGDFFSFHSFKLISGSYISDSDLMRDRVVISENLAWRLYGATDLAGMTANINGNEYYIAGVVRLTDDYFSKKTRDTDEILFMSYDAMLKENTNTSISCYEIVLPDAVDDWGKAIVEQNFPCGNGEVVQYRARYSLKNLFAVIGDFGLRSTSTNTVAYPFWENAVRVSEDYAALFLILMIVFGICPLITLCVLAIKFIKLIVANGKAFITSNIEKKIESKRENDYQKRLERKGNNNG